MKILNKIKKHFNKILIACLTLISSIVIFSSINKTYAYTTDRLSYTIDSISNNNNSIISTKTINNKTGYYYSWQYYDRYFLFGLDLNNTILQNIDFIDCYIMFNYYICDGTTIYDYENLNTNINVRYYIDGNGGNNYISLPQLKNSQAIYNITNNNMYTYIAKISIGSNVYNNKLYINFSNFNYGFLITNIDIVTPSDIGLHQYYETYYSQIEDNYLQLQSDYNDLQDNYQDLEDNYNTLEDNYNDLETNYNNLNNSYNNINEIYTRGSFAYFTELNAYDSSNNDYTYTMEQLINNNYAYDNSVDLGKIANEKLTMNNNYIDLYFNNLPIPLTNFTLKDLQGSTITLSFKNNLDNYIFKRINGQDDEILIDYNYIYENYTDINTDYYIVQISFNEVNNSLEFRNAIIRSNALETATYTNGYNNGYNKATTERNNYYEPQINNLTNQIELLNEQITQQRVIINALQEQIASISDDYNLNNLMWTIAGTPFESFKQIWNVNFLGVNISQMVTGIITAFIVLYIVKKFFL